MGSDYKNDIAVAPVHVCHVFDDVDDMVWFTNELLWDIANHHAPVKQKMIKKDSVPYMNSKLRKNLYLRNMTRNKYKNMENNIGTKITAYNELNWVTPVATGQR